MYFAAYNSSRNDLHNHMYLLSEIKPPNAIQASLYTAFGKHDYPVLVSCRVDKVEFARVDPDKSTKTHLFSIYTSNPILALAGVKYLGDDIIVALDSTFTVLVLYQNHTLVERAVTKLSFKGQQQSIDSVPLFAVDPSKSPSFFVLHTFQGVIQLFVFGDTKLLSKKRRSDDLWSVSLISIGSVVVLKMVMLTGSLLAILYRTFNFDYALRYYTVDPQKKTIVLTKQFEEFDEAPTCMIPMRQGGIVIVSALHIFYFPQPNTYLTLSDECVDPTISINTHANHVTKDISGNRDLLKESFATYETIDESRVLLVSNTGSCYILYFEATASNKALQVNNVVLTQLGKLTIPTTQGLHHINDNYFYQASKSSRSVLFQIFPHKPYIHINSFLDSSPPVLNIDALVENGALEISTCQGGIHSGEFRRYTPNMSTLRLKKQFPGMTSLSKKNRNKVMDVHVDVPDCTIFDSRQIGPDTLHITNTGIFKNTQNIYTEEMMDGMFIGQLMVTIQNNNLTIRNQYKVLHSTEITREFRNMDVCEAGDIHFILVTWWDGLYSVYNSTLDLAWNGSIPEGIFSSAILYQEYVYVLLLTQDGKLRQFQFDPKTTIKYEIHPTTLELNTYPLKVSKFGSKVILFNDTSLFGLVLDILLGIFAPHQIPFTGDIKDLSILDEVTIAILSKSSIDTYNWTTAKSLDLFQFSTRHSNLLITKSVHMAKYSVILLQETKIDSNVSYLELIDNTTLKPIHKYSFKKPVELVDICKSGKEIVAISNEISDPLYTFNIKDRKIALLDESTIQGIATIPDTKLYSIKLYEDDVFCITGNVNFLVRNNDDVWSLIPSSTSQVPVFAIASTVCDDTIFVGDVMHGLFEAKVSEDYDVRLSKINMDYQHYFLTSVDSRKMNGVVVSGDSFGNVSVLELKDQTCAFNIGDQVNCIKCLPNGNNVAVIGTVNGGLYKLSIVDDEETCEILESCQKELGTRSTPYSNSRRDWKLIQKQDSGLYSTKDHFGVIDIRLIRKFLGEKLLNLLSKSSGGRLSKVSSKNKATLERVVFEASLW